LPGNRLRIEFTRKADASLDRLPKEIAIRIISKLEWLAEHPESKVKQLTGLPAGLAGLLKYRVGDYRILFWITEESIIVYRIGHRSEIYKNI
jgi:mRNA-degrading endonuclease RelE of RelBE toxin-antitoxin system